MSSAAVRLSSLSQGKQMLGLCHGSRTHRTNAMILGGLLRRVWKNLELMMRYGVTRARKVSSVMLKGNPSI